MKSNAPYYSVVVPVYNSAPTLRELVHRLRRVLFQQGAGFEIILVNDGSKDTSWKIISEMAEQYEEVQAINLTKNFGQHNALMCSFSFVSGQYIITIDDDLQIPPEEIPRLIETIEGADHDIVYGVYGEKRHSAFRNLGSRFVQLVYRMSFNCTKTVTSFRIIRREIVDRILGYEKS